MGAAGPLAGLVLQRSIMAAIRDAPRQMEHWRYKEREREREREGERERERERERGELGFLV